MVLKILKHKISKNQLLGFTLANFVGLSIILLGIQIYSDMNPILSSKDSFIQDEYIILTKGVSSLTTLTGNSPSFTEQEITKLKEQSFVKSVGEFQASNFNVRADIGFVGKQFGITTDMFFESVPNEFVDIDHKDWRDVPLGGDIPIIVPRSYLDLYNFGFAASRSLPNISEGLINMITLKVSLSGNGIRENYGGRIVGFSKRLNTILVPDAFLKRVNSELSPKENTEPLRLIIQVDNSSDTALAQYIKDNNYLIDGNQLETGRARYFLNVSISIVLFVGVLICILACYVLILSVYLLMEKNIHSLENLVLLGYSNGSIALPYLMIATLLTLVSSILAVIAVYIGKLIYHPLISTVVTDPIAKGLSFMTFASIILIFLGISVISYLVISRKVKRISAFKD